MSTYTRQHSIWKIPQERQSVHGTTCGKAGDREAPNPSSGTTDCDARGAAGGLDLEAARGVRPGPRQVLLRPRAHERGKLARVAPKVILAEGEVWHSGGLGSPVTGG